MHAQDSIAVVARMIAAARARDEAAYIACFAEDAVLRQAGVPGGLGGALEGRAAILAAFRRMPARPEIEVRQIFADDHGNVCVLRRLTAPSFPGEGWFTAAERTLATYDCLVYRVEDGAIRAGTRYCNVMDHLVRSGALSVEEIVALQPP